MRPEKHHRSRQKWSNSIQVNHLMILMFTNSGNVEQASASRMKWRRKDLEVTHVRKAAPSTWKEFNGTHLQAGLRPSSIVTTYDDVKQIVTRCVHVNSWVVWILKANTANDADVLGRDRIQNTPREMNLRLQIMVFFVESIFFALLRKCQTAAGCFCWIHTLDLTCGLWESGLSLAKLPHTAAYDLGATGILVGSQCIGCIWRTVQAMEKGAVPVFFLAGVSMVLWHRAST